MLSTVATSVSELLQLYNALASTGVNVGVRVYVSPVVISREDLSKETAVAFDFTVTLHVAFRLLSRVSVITAVPIFLAVIVPVLSTVATSVSELLQLYNAFASTGVNVGVRVYL